MVLVYGVAVVRQARLPIRRDQPALGNRIDVVASASVTTSACSPSITARACAPEPPLEV